jgi:predicted Zn-dependent protease
MQPLEPPDAHHLNAAIGWLELGCRDDARAELDLISTAHRTHPAVLEVRWMICVEEKQWDAALIAARDLLSSAPQEPTGWLHYAYALRRAKPGGLKQAWGVLRPIAAKFPKEHVIAFNLACYACQLQELAEARDWLQRACAIRGKEHIKQMALADVDLKPLWDEIQNL